MKTIAEVKKQLQERIREWENKSYFGGTEEQMNIERKKAKLEGIEMAEKLAKQELIREIEKYFRCEKGMVYPEGTIFAQGKDWQSLKKKHGVDV